MERRSLLLGLGTASLLTGCQTIKKITEVVKDPAVKVGEDKDQPNELTFNAIGTSDMNDGKPIVISIFALSGDHRFYGFDMYSLIKDPKESLGLTLVDQLDEISLRPGEYDTFGPYKLPERTKLIGAIAQFLNFEKAIWRDTIEIEATGGDSKNALISISSAKMTMRLEQ